MIIGCKELMLQVGAFAQRLTLYNPLHIARCALPDRFRQLCIRRSKNRYEEMMGEKIHHRNRKVHKNSQIHWEIMPSMRKI